MTDLFLPFLKGFVLMASVIFAVGPQNAMLIRQGLRRENPLLVATIFTLCDFVLIALGVIGIGQYVVKIDWLRLVIVYGGAAFLFWFALKAFYAAWKGGQTLSNTDIPKRGTLVASALAVSLLNPGALIDTLVIVGSVSSKYAFDQAIAFGAGAQVFSAAFFFLLAGFTSRFAPYLNNPSVWRGIDIVVGLITIWIGIHLLTMDF